MSTLLQEDVEMVRNGVLFDGFEPLLSSFLCECHKKY